VLVLRNGSFVYIPKGTPLPMEVVYPISRINEQNTVKFERTLIIADEGSRCQFILEGCTAHSEMKTNCICRG